MIRALIAFAVLASALLAQIPSGPTVAVFTATHESTGTSGKVTIQQPASGSRRVRLKQAAVYTSTACDVTQSRNGTAATTTAFTPARNNPEGSGASTALAYHTSNVGAGTQIGQTITTQAGIVQSMDLEGIYMLTDGTAVNYTVAVSCSTSSTFRISVKYEEH